MPAPTTDTAARAATAPRRAGPLPLLATGLALALAACQAPAGTQAPAPAPGGTSPLAPPPAAGSAGSLAAKTDYLVRDCAARGRSKAACRCILDYQERELGPDAIEAKYLQVTGDIPGYERKLNQIIARNPDKYSPEYITNLDVKARAKCEGY